MHIAITIWAVIASWKTWSWERFYKFHATILYISAMNLLYLYFSKEYPLWKMQPDLGIPLSIVEMLYTFIIFPCTAILFLSHYPNSPKRRLYHIVKWIIIYFGLEWIGSLFGLITYDNGWNLVWSFVFVVMMIVMFRLHYKRPLLTYVLTFIMIVLIFYYFKVPWAVPVEERL